VFRADEIVDRGSEITISARTNDDVVYRLEGLRDQMHGRRRVRFVYGDRVVDADLGGVERTVRFGGAARRRRLIDARSTRPAGRIRPHQYERNDAG